MAMKKVAGTELSTGMSKIDGMVAQNGSRSAGGELKVFKDEDGNVMTLYVDDEHSEVSFEGLLKGGETVAHKKIGDAFTACGVTGYITAWTVSWTHDDASKVSGTRRDYTIATTTENQSKT